MQKELDTFESDIKKEQNYTEEQDQQLQDCLEGQSELMEKLSQAIQDKNKMIVNAIYM